MPKKTTKKKKITKNSKSPKKDFTLNDLLDESEGLEVKLEDFNHNFLAYLAETEYYEVCPTTDESGSLLKSDHYNLLKKESRRLGVKILFSYEIGKNVMILNLDTLKSGMISNTGNIEVH